VLRSLCQEWLEPLRDRFGRVTVHSGHRSAAWNRAVGGAPLSQHVYGEHGYGVAADVSCERGTPREWFEFLDRLGAPALGLYDTHVHVDNRRQHARW
jgi:zinc D-Ala-D-Ala carboxypeptidase